MPLHAVPQLGFDEVQVTEPALERALEARHERRLTASEARRLFNEAHEAATAEVAKLELPEGGAVRCGRFRVTRSTVPARSVSFETEAKSRIKIGLIGEDE